MWRSVGAGKKSNFAYLSVVLPSFVETAPVYLENCLSQRMDIYTPVYKRAFQTPIQNLEKYKKKSGENE